MKKSIALLISFLMVLTLLPAVALAADAADWDDVMTAVDGSETNISLTASTTIGAGTYNLMGKTVTFSGTATISGNVTITNGTILRGANNKGALFEVDSGDSLTLENVIVDGQKSTITANMPLVNISTDGTVTLGKGAVLTNNKSDGGGEGSAVTVDGGKLRINGGSIKDNETTATNNKGGTIKTYYGATVTMTDGEISGNSGATHGGAIQLYGRQRSSEGTTSTTTFTMSGGTISGNTANGVGGGVAVSAEAKFVMSGGSITDNSCGSSSVGGGVAFSEKESNNISMEISGAARITNNKKNGVANNLEIGTANLLKVTGALSGANIGITRTNNSTNVFTTSESGITPADYIDQFSSDNTSYYVAKNDSGQLQLKETTTSITIGTNLTENGTANPGETLSVSASAGDAAVSYQWYSCTDENKYVASAISGETNSSFTIPTDLSAGDHYYFCRIRAEGANPVDSNVVKVTKAATYTVTYTDGVGGAVFANQVYDNLTAGTPTPAFNGTPSRSGFTFTGWSPSVAATVTSDTTYTAQWRKNSTTAGSDSSNSPAITSPTTDQEVFVYVNSNATMSIDARDAKTYQWYVDRGNGFEAISGATGASYTTSKVELKNDGYRYYCVATNAYGTDISPIFTLNVTKDIVTPKTGDNAQNGLWTGLIMIAAAGLFACTVVWRKRSQA